LGKGIEGSNRLEGQKAQFLLQFLIPIGAKGRTPILGPYWGPGGPKNFLGKKGYFPKLGRGIFQGRTLGGQLP